MRYTDEQYALARTAMVNGASYAQAAEATGVSQQMLRKKFPEFVRGKRPDPVPGGGETSRQEPYTPPRVQNVPTSPTPKVTDAQLVSVFSKVAAAPAIPMGLWFQCEFCAMHFAVQGPKTAAALVEISHDSPALRSVMEMMYGYAAQGAWAALIAGYVAVPVAHHMLPDRYYGIAGAMLGLPPRNSGVHFHGPVAPEPEPAAPPVTPYSHMDTDQLLAMAEKMGIQVEVGPDGLVQPVEVSDDAAAPESPESTAEPAVTDATVTADEIAPDATDSDPFI